MPECSYCEASFEDEESYLDHLADEHAGELSAIDQRRVEGRGEEDGGVPTGPLVLGGVIGVAALLVGYVTLFAGGGSAAPELGQPGTAHEHGTINVTIAGETLDFGQERFQLQDRRFHFERGTEVWHKHATGVTLAYAMDTLGIEVTEDTVAYQGTTYREGDPGTEVVVAVNGEPVDPETYVLQGVEEAASPQEGDSVRIVVRTEG